MRTLRIALLFAIWMPVCVFAQASEQGTESVETPEEVIVIGNRNVLDLRLQMQDLERAAYEMFNRFNDEPRFNISCGEQEPTGTRFKNQLCQPHFVREAAAQHGRAYWENLRASMDGYTADKDPPRPGENYEFAVNRQLDAYRAKIKGVAEKHPEFLEAVKRYAESRQQYEQATSTAR